MTCQRLAFGVWRLAFGVWRLASPTPNNVDGVRFRRAAVLRPEKADPLPQAAETSCRCPKRAMNSGVPIRGGERFPNRERRTPNAKRGKVPTCAEPVFIARIQKCRIRPAPP
jgi:hypothetical protein